MLYQRSDCFENIDNKCETYANRFLRAAVLFPLSLLSQSVSQQRIAALEVEALQENGDWVDMQVIIRWYARYS